MLKIKYIDLRILQVVHLRQLDNKEKGIMSHPLRNVTTEGAILGGIIAQLRAVHAPEITQQDLAKAMGLSASAWSRVEKGETELTALQLKRVAQVLGTDTNTIVDLVDKMAKKLKEAGVGVEPTTIRNLISAHGSALAASGAVGALAATVVPVIGPVLGVLLGAYMSTKINKKD